MTETQAPGPVEPGAQPRAHIPRWLIGTLLGSAAVIVALLVVVVVLVTRDGSDSSTTSASDDSSSETAKTFAVAGDITLTSYDGVFKVGGGECTGQNGYDDMAAGAQVVITDATGKTIAVGSLDGGVSESGFKCRFAFTIDNVPDGTGPFAVQVSHRGSIAFNREDATNLHLTLG